MFLHKNHEENGTGRLVPDTFFLLIIQDKNKWPGAWFQYFLIALNLAYSKNKLYKNVDYLFRDILTFNFLGSNKMFLMLYSIN